MIDLDAVRARRLAGAPIFPLAGASADGAILDAEHDLSSRTLTVTFASGVVRHYEGVPGTMYLAMQASSSVDIFFELEIRHSYPSFVATPAPPVISLDEVRARRRDEQRT